MLIRASQISIWGLNLINAMLSNIYYNIPKNTTLNEKFGILPYIRTPKGVKGAPTYPKLKYFTIGIGCDTKTDDETNYYLSEHSPVDAALFKHIPFVLREPHNDLTISERKKYRLRTEIYVNGVTYIAYYAKVCEQIELPGFNFVVRKLNGIDVLNIFDTNTDKLLNPKPIKKPRANLQALEAPTIIGRYKMEFSLTPAEQNDLLNVYKILNLSPTTKITEIGICFGHEFEGEGTKEIVDVQIGYFIDLDLDVIVDFKQGELFSRDIELGGAEPYFTGA